VLPKYENAAMREGTRRHEIAETILKGGVPYTSGKDTALVTAAFRLKDTTDVLLVEHGFAFNLSNGSSRRIASRGASGYDVANNEVPCTVDVVYLDMASNTLVVRDWKLGSRGIELQPSPRESGQLLFSMLCVLRSGVITIDTGVSLAVEFADDANTVRNSVTLKDINEFASDLVFSAMGLDGEKPSAPVPGGHCKWCPIVATCAGANNAITTTANDITKGRFRLPLAIANEQDAVDFLKANEFISQYQKRLEEQVKAFADTHQVVVDGRVYSSEMQSRTVTTDIGTPDNYDASSAPEGSELRVVAKHKGAPYPVYRLRKP
jgi:hypothetical protein